MAEQGAGHKAMAELYREEVSTLGSVLGRDVLKLEAISAQGDHATPESVRERVQGLFASLLRAAHSLKGAARVMRFTRVADVAHEVEETLVAGQRAASLPDQQVLDALLRATDFINASGTWVAGQNDTVGTLHEAEVCINALRREVTRMGSGGKGTPEPDVVQDSAIVESAGSHSDPVLRVRAELINELLQLGAQGRVLSHRLDQLPQHFLRLSEQQLAAEHELDACSAQLAAQGLDAALRRELLAPLRGQMARLRSLQNELYNQTSQCAQEQALLSERWYAQVLSCRTRPFSDIVSGFPRLVRDIGRQLGKQLVLHVEGAATLADRDIMESLEMPLVHLLRNACSHGIEQAAVRAAAGKPQQGVITLAARHSDGWLQVSVRDDGGGIDPERIRHRLQAQGSSAGELSLQELQEYIFTEGFSTAGRADAVSGRGVGLAAVRDRMHELGGQLSVKSELGVGAVFTLQVPVTRALLRVLCFYVGGEPYALPLGQIESLIRVNAQEQGLGVVSLGGQSLPVIRLQSLLGGHSGNPLAVEPDSGLGDSPAGTDRVGGMLRNAAPSEDGSRRMLVLRHHGRRCVLDVGTIEDESELIVHELDARLGNLPLFQSAGLNERGEVVLVLDLEGLCGQIAESLKACPPVPLTPPDTARRMRVLLAEDSALARARIGSILAQAGGFELTGVADGLSAWHRLQAEPERFDLLLSDFEMPGMDGCKLACKVRAAPPPLNTLPIVIISAKDGECDCDCGKDAGANLYLSKTLLGTDPDSFVSALLKLRQLHPE